MSFTIIISSWAYLPKRRSETPSKLNRGFPGFHSCPELDTLDLQFVSSLRMVSGAVRKAIPHNRPVIIIISITKPFDLPTSCCYLHSSNAATNDNLSNYDATIFYRLPTFYFPLVRGSSLYISRRVIFTQRANQLIS